MPVVLLRSESVGTTERLFRNVPNPLLKLVVMKAFSQNVFFKRNGDQGVIFVRIGRNAF